MRRLYVGCDAGRSGLMSRNGNRAWRVAWAGVTLAGIAVTGAAPAGPAAASPASAAASRSWLNAVAATSARDAWAVGVAGGGDLIVHWNGTAWKPVPSPDRAGSALFGVSAVSARCAWAVGQARHREPL